MPAVMVLRQRDNPGAEDTGDDYKPRVWRAGEIVKIFEETHRFGFLEMPIQSFGNRTVDQVNGLDVTTVPLYSAVQLSDSGTITSGTGPDVDVSVGDTIVLQADDSWTNFGLRATVPNGFYHIRISDKTVEEVELYLEKFNKKLSYQSDQFDPQTDLRRFTTTNERVSVSGNNSFTEQGILDAIDAWNAAEPSDPSIRPNPNPVTLVDTDNFSYFQCDGIMPIEVFDEWKLNTQQFALADYYKRRRWYITQSGLQVLENNNGTLNGTAADVNPFLRDGLLD